MALECLYKVLLVASKKAIARRWLQANLPSKDDWITIVNEIHCMEKLTYSLGLRPEQYIKYWNIGLLTLWDVIYCLCN